MQPILIRNNTDCGAENHDPKGIGFIFAEQEERSKGYSQSRKIKIIDWRAQLIVSGQREQQNAGSGSPDQTGSNSFEALQNRHNNGTVSVAAEKFVAGKGYCNAGDNAAESGNNGSGKTGDFEADKAG